MKSWANRIGVSGGTFSLALVCEYFCLAAACVELLAKSEQVKAEAVRASRSQRSTVLRKDIAQ